MMKTVLRKSLGFAIAATCAFCGSAHGSLLWVGNDTATAVHRYTSSGSFVGPWGATGATGTALDGAGHAYTVVPSAYDSVITKYDVAEAVVATIHFTAGIENGNGYPSWIEDMGYDGSHIWLSGYNGVIYKIDGSGTILTYVDTGHTFAGITSDGSSLYTTRGFGATGVIDVRDLTGAVTGSITTTIAGEMGGIGFDASDSTLWIGASGTIHHVNLAGAYLGSLSIGSYFHDGLEVGELGATPTPEGGATLGLLLLGAASLVGGRKRVGFVQPIS